MNISKFARIAMVSICAFACLHGASRADENQLKNAQTKIEMMSNNLTRIEQNLGLKPYDTAFLHRLEILDVKDRCNGLNKDIITKNVADGYANCLEDKGYIFVKTLRAYEIYHKGLLLFAVDRTDDLGTLWLELGKLSDLSAFKETFKISNRKFQVELLDADICKNGCIPNK
jgi:hypothetical protein